MRGWNEFKLWRPQVEQFRLEKLSEVNWSIHSHPIKKCLWFSSNFEGFISRPVKSISKTHVQLFSGVNGKIKLLKIGFFGFRESLFCGFFSTCLCCVFGPRWSRCITIYNRKWTYSPSATTSLILVSNTPQIWLGK